MSAWHPRIVGRLAGGLFAMAALCAACVKTVRVEPRDWGGIPPDEEIRVHTVAGAEHDLTSVVVGRTLLVGMRVNETGAPESVEIPTDSIDFIEARSTAVFRTALIPLATAAAIGLIVAHSEDDTRPDPPPNSCPFVYSFDGEGYRLDSETFAGAITRGLERTDVDNLDHLVEIDGAYRLLLTNERPETQYTDALTLLAVDHPVGTEVLPDVEGDVRLAAGLAPPTAARGLHGGDALDAVRTRGGPVWGGAPLEAVDPADDRQLRDGLVLSFPRPAGSEALLAVRAQNTPIAPFALRTILALHGDGLMDWYRAIDRGGAERDDVRRWVQREGMLHVSVEVDGAWQLQDALIDVGPHLPKTQVARLDLSGIEGDEVRVRLEAARGLWRFDRIALGSDRTDELEIIELALATATAEGRADPAAALSRRDGVYYTSFEGDRVELRFPAAPPPRDGSLRSILLQSTGFYHIATDHRGRPGEAELVDRILREPLFGNRYILDRWRAEAGAARGN